ncbi:MAG: phosphotransferase [Chloroflexota bacterium]
MADTLLDYAAAVYDLSASQLTPMSGGYTTRVYQFARDGQEYVLRIIPPDVDIDLRSTLAKLAWLEFLGSHRGPVSRPVRSPQGNLIESVAYTGQTYLVEVFEKAAGVLAENMTPEDWNEALFVALGDTVGRCHAIARDYVPENEELRLPQWDQAVNCFNPMQELVGAEGFILEQRAKVVEAIQALPKDRQDYGLAHLDLHFANFYVDTASQQITFFDFDDCAYGWYIMDIAMLIFDVLVVYNGLDRQQFGARFLESLLRGYLPQKPMRIFWMQQLPHFVKLLEISIYAELYRDYDPATAGEWVNKFMLGREQCIRQGVPYVSLDFDGIYRKATLGEYESN